MSGASTNSRSQTSKPNLFDPTANLSEVMGYVQTERRWLFVGWLFIVIGWSIYGFRGLGSVMVNQVKDKVVDNEPPKKPPKEPPKEPPTKPDPTNIGQEDLISKGTRLIQEAGALPQKEWKKKSALYREAGKALSQGGREIPRHLERSADAFVFAGDLLRSNGSERQAVEDYSEAIAVYDLASTLISDVDSQLSKRIKRKRDVAKALLGGMEPKNDAFKNVEEKHP